MIPLPCVLRFAIAIQPTRLTEPMAAYRMAHRPLHPPPLALDPCELYHQLHPHPALSPPPTSSDPSAIAEQRENEEQWRQLVVQGALAITLPTDDLENSCLRSLVTEALSEMILGNGLGGKICEGWFIWSAITKMIELVRFRAASIADVEIELESSTIPDRLHQFGLLNSPRETEPRKAGGSRVNPRHQNSSVFACVSRVFWTAIQYTMIAFTILRTVVVALATSSSLPARSSITIVSALPSPPAVPQQALPNNDSPADTSGTPSSSTSINHERRAVKKRPVVSMRVWSCIGRLLELDVRMPWIAGLLSFVHDVVVSGPGKVGNTDGALDR